MALTKEDLLAIRALMQEEVKPINERLDKMDSQLDQLQEDMEFVKYTLKETLKDVGNIEQRIIRHEREFHHTA